MLGFAMEIRTITESWAPLFLQNAQNNFNPKQFWTIFEIGGLIGSLVSGALVQLFYRVMSKEASRFLVANFSTFFLLLMSTWLFFDSTYYTLLAFFIGFNVYGAINPLQIRSSHLFLTAARFSPVAQ
uniref:Uncharacterized protein n=1 Tax=Acrobeloides nanus TaxID=290746 RepID=A0A914BXC1_9BILA